jgi:hypothetical protein
MIRTFLAAILVLVSLPLTGCGSGGSSAPPTIVTQILSDPAFDGDIAQDPVTGLFTITHANTTQNVFAGIDPVTKVEYRAFLDFPLSGVGGVPLSAVIASATLDIVINDVQTLTGTIPIRIDLVFFQPPSLIGTDYSLTLQPALATITTSIFQTDVGHHVVVDVTSLMTEAQRQGLPDFQIRILEDLGIVPLGLFVIDDTIGADRGLFAPLLQVSYF